MEIPKYRHDFQFRLTYQRAAPHSRARGEGEAGAARGKLIEDCTCPSLDEYGLTAASTRSLVRSTCCMALAMGVFRWCVWKDILYMERCALQGYLHVAAVQKEIKTAFSPNQRIVVK